MGAGTPGRRDTVAKGRSVTLRESDIAHESGRYWVWDRRDKAPAYVVMRPHGSTASETDSAYPRTPDGLSIAKARADYLARRAATPKNLSTTAKE